MRVVRAKNPDIVIMLDNTWAAGVLLKALELGVDISFQAGIKYLCGHSDAMIGTAVTNARCWDQLREQSYLMDKMVDTDTAYMVERGLRTFGIWLKQHEENGIRGVRWLTQRPEVSVVNHPALPGCKGHGAFLLDFTGASGFFPFVLKQRLNGDQLITLSGSFYILQYVLLLYAL